MPHFDFMHPLVVDIGMPTALLVLAAVAYYNTRLLEGLRKFYAPAGMFLLDIFSPRNTWNVISIWSHWLAITILIVLAAGMPSVSVGPEFVQKGAVEVEFVIQVNNAMGDESDRPNHPTGDPGEMYQWGSRLDMVRRFIENDMLPQLAGNKTGITSFEGKGYNLWDLTDDNQSPVSAFRVMLDNFTRVGAAPGAGANIASGLATALAEFDLIDDLEQKAGDTTHKEHFIVLFADGNYSSDGQHPGDQQALSAQEAELVKRGVHLLIVGMGEPDNVTVPRYDPLTHQRNGSFDGQTRYRKDVLDAIQKSVPGSDFVYVPPGTEHISYNFPKKLGGLYAVPASSNLCSWLVLAAMIVLLNLTFTGGRLPNKALIGAAFGPIWRYGWSRNARLREALRRLLRRSTNNEEQKGPLL